MFAPLPKKRYHIIYADPPWNYNDKHPGKAGNQSHSAVKHYDLVSIDDLCTMRVEQIAENNCVLYMWATSPLLPEALDLMKAWGFTFKNVGFTWIKLEPHGGPMFGTGAYTKGNAEFCLFGTRGRVGRKVRNQESMPIEKLAPLSNFVSSVVTTSRHNNKKWHSAKPNKVRENIVRLWGDISRIELFARDRAEGWDAWGNQLK